MTNLNDLPCSTLGIKAIQWCNKNNLITTEDKINRVIEGTTQGDVFLSWVSAHLDLVEIHTIENNSDLKNTYDELTKVAIEKCPNYNQALVKFCNWTSENKNILAEKIKVK